MLDATAKYIQIPAGGISFQAPPLRAAICIQENGVRQSGHRPKQHAMHNHRHAVEADSCQADRLPANSSRALHSSQQFLEASVRCAKNSSELQEALPGITEISNVTRCVHPPEHGLSFGLAPPLLQWRVSTFCQTDVCLQLARLLQVDPRTEIAHTPFCRC